jgi:EAL domain-containing protein (putative c-di-GMP-specific phosphodiesterase class I)/GGDEF domain-containing protein
MDGNVIYERSVPLKIKGVPSWFVERIHLKTTAATVPVGREWRLVGELSVLGHRGHAYEQLWQVFREVVGGFLLLSLLAIAGIYVLLKTVLRSLERVREQAEAVVGNRFVVQKDIPRTKEFRDVVLAMNALVLKVKEIYRQESEAIARYNALLYEDGETGFYNRNHFRIRLEGYLRAQDRFSEGCLILLQVRDYDDLHKARGANGMHELILRLRDSVLRHTERLHDAVRCRLRESDMMVILPSMRKEKALPVADAIAGECGRNDCPVACALITYHAGEALGEVMSAADSALMMAEGSEAGKAYYFEREKSRLPVLGHDAWVGRIREAMVRETFVLMGQPVRNTNDMAVQYEMLLRYEDGEQVLTAGEFMPIVAGVEMLEELDRYVVGLLARVAGSRNVAVNVSHEFISKTANLQWLDTFATLWREKGLKVAFEVANGSVMRDPLAVEAFAAYLQERGWEFGIDHFTVGSYDLQLLQSIKPDYLKVEASYLLGLIGSGEEKVRTSALFTITDLLDIRLVATGVEDAGTARQLRENGIEWLMGFGIAEPTREELS